MINKQRGLLVVALLLSLTAQLAATSLTFTSVDALIRYGLSRNAALNATLSSWESSKSLPAKLSGLPDPKIGVRFNGAPAKNSDYSFDQKRYLLSQSFPFFGDRAHLREEGEAKGAVSYLDLVLAQNEVRHSIESLVYKLQLNNALSDITKKNKETLIQLSNIADVKYQAGLGLQAQVIKAQVSKGTLEEELLSLSHSRVVLMEALKQSLNVEGGSDISLDIPAPSVPKISVSRPNKNWAAKSVAVQKSEAIKAVQESVLAVEKDRFSPKFSAQFELWDNPGSDNQVGGQLMMSVPWFYSSNKAAIKEAEGVVAAREFAVEEALNKTHSRLVSLVSDINTTQQKIVLYDTQLLRDARLSFSNFQKSYEVGNASFIDYFEAEQTVFQLEKKQARLINHYHTQSSALKWHFEKGELPHE